MKIKMFVMDVDGTLTDGKINISATGELFKSFCVKDGEGVRKLLKIGIIPVVITGRESKIVSKRMRELNIKEVYQSVSNKKELLHLLCEKYNIILENIAYIGDDDNDFESIKISGISGCPSDASERIKQVVSYISDIPGGAGAVRDFIEYLIKYNLLEVNL